MTFKITHILQNETNLPDCWCFCLGLKLSINFDIQHASIAHSFPKTRQRNRHRRSSSFPVSDSCWHTSTSHSQQEAHVASLHVPFWSSLPFVPATRRQSLHSLTSHKTHKSPEYRECDLQCRLPFCLVCRSYSTAIIQIAPDDMWCATSTTLKSPWLLISRNSTEPGDIFQFTSS